MTYVLTWTISTGERGAFCPAGGMTKSEAEKARERLYQRAEGEGMRRAQRGSPGDPQKKAIGASLVPYVFDLDSDPIPGLAPQEET